MKTVLLILLTTLLGATAARADNHRPHGTRRLGCAAAETEIMAPRLACVAEAGPAAANAACAARAGRLAAYYADMLRLSYVQTKAVRQAALALLQAQDEHPAGAGAPRQFEAAMLRLLQPGQYGAFRFLSDTKPLPAGANLAVR